MKNAILLKITLTSVFSASMILSAANEETSLKIAVSSKIDRPFEGWRKAPIKEHGKAYLLASISEGRSGQELILPVDEVALLDHLRKELAKRGFHEVQTEKPEIILTVIYGRGFLKNPHFYDSPTTGDPPMPNLATADRKYLRNRHDYGFQEKVDKANLEKLFIRVTAWANPADQIPKKPDTKTKPKELWHTTMTIDDPGNRDLNQLMDKLLAAGSHFFDREMDNAEEIIDNELPEGSVHFGEAKVIEDE